MSLVMATILFFVITLGMVVIPFVPALVEWRRKKDAEPLKVVRDSEVDARHFAIKFREFVEDRFTAAFEKCKKNNTAERGKLEDGTPYVIMKDGEIPALTDQERRDGQKQPLILSCGDVQLPGDTIFAGEIYASGSVTGGEKGVVKAVLAEEEIHLARESTSLRWLHGGRSVSADAGSVLFGRASADGHIRIERGCRFERLHAPRIEFCYDAKAGEMAGGMVYRESNVLKTRDISNPVEVAGGRWLISGDLEVPEGKIVETDVVATGNIHIKPGVRVIGSMKSRKDMHIDKGVEVEGSVVSEHDIHIGVDCSVHGPILAEGSVFIRKGTTVGSNDHPTTVSAEKLYIEPGVLAHGTVWAHIDGRVAVPASAAGSKKDNDGSN